MSARDLGLTCRVALAFGADTLDWTPTWTALDEATYPSLVSSYTIERGRQYELDRTDTGRATVTINDREGLFDPTNPDALGPITPLTQVLLQRHNPVAGGWHSRFRGFVEEWSYEWDPSQQVNRLELQLVDLFELISSIEMYPGQFGDTPPAESEGQVFFLAAGSASDHTGMKIRCYQVLGDAGIPIDWFVVFSGNVAIKKTVYSPGESAMTAIQEAVDAEFPSVGNAYCDRFGRLAVHGRYARFDPAGTAANVDDPGVWDFQDWKAGGGGAVAASPSDTAHVRTFGTKRGLSQIINRGLATPAGIADAAVAGQIYEDTASVGKYGIRGWSAQNLLTDYGTTDGVGALEECQRFAAYYVENFSTMTTDGGRPKVRITNCGFRSSHPDAVGSGANWALLNRIDIGDRLTVHVAGAGGGGFTGAAIDSQHIVEGIHEEARPLRDGFDDVTMTLDLSPFAYSEHNPFSAMPPGPP